MSNYLNSKIVNVLNQFNFLKKLKQSKGLDAKQEEKLFYLSTTLIQLLVNETTKMKKQLLMQEVELANLKKGK